MAGILVTKIAKTGDNQFLKAVALISNISGIVSIFMIVLAVLITCQLIFVRFVLNQSTIWQTEMVIYLMVGATLIGLPFVQRLRGHVNVDLIPLALPGNLRFALAVFTLVLSISIVGVMLWYGFEYWHIAWERGWRSDTVWGVKLWKPYLVLPVGFALLLLQLCADLVAVVLSVEKPFGIEGDS
jgi:TRAP-type C4-dicarboxylate transport system permease small subunit